MFADLVDNIMKIYNMFTRIGVTGYSGKAMATALAPSSLVKPEIPTKNSRPKIIFMMKFGSQWDSLNKTYP